VNKVYNIKNPIEWVQVTDQEILHFECVAGSRNFALSINCNMTVEVWSSFYEDMSEAVLVACDHGSFQMGLTSAIDVYIQFRFPSEASVFVRFFAANYIVSKKDELLFVTMMPQGRNSDLDRMMRMMAMNEKARDIKL